MNQHDYLLHSPNHGKPLHVIALEVCEARKILPREFFSHRRTRHLTLARQEAYWRAYNETDASLPQIGRAFGGRDHSTILWGVRRHEERMKAGVNGA